MANESLHDGQCHRRLPVPGLLLRRLCCTRRRRGPRRSVGGRGRCHPGAVGPVRRRRLGRAPGVEAGRGAGETGAAALDAAGRG
jgi:hypothetical protein